MNYEILSRSPIFRGMDAESIQHVLQKTHYRIRKFHPASVIAITGEEVTSLHIVLSGMVKGEMIDYAGRTLKIEDIGAPRALAPAFLFGSGNRFPVNVTSVTDVKLLIIEKSDFIIMLGGNTTILTNYLETISNRSQFLSEKIKFFTFKTIKGKLAHYILEKADDRLAKIRFGRTQQELADFFGVARPSISRAIREMEDEGLIIAEGKDITILKKEGLSELTRH